MAGSADFDLYRPSEEHDMLRDAIRSLAEAKIAPFAAAVDEEARFPQEALDALVANDLHAVHVPEEYGGAGADALATVIVIEEVARACVSLLPDPGREQARLAARDPLRLRGAEEEVPGPARQGRRDVLVLPLRAGRRLRRGRHEDPRGPRRRPLRPQRREALDHQRGRLRVLHGHGRHGPGRSAPRASPPSSSRSPTRASPSAPRRRSSASRAPRPARSTSTTSASPPTA